MEIGALLALIVPALIPVASDAIRGIVGKFTGGAGASPQNVEETIKLMGAETERLKALAELDRPVGEISKWVADLRASFRYIMAAVVIIVAAISIFIPNLPPHYVEMVWQSAGSVWSFIFGDRMYSYMRKK